MAPRNKRPSFAGGRPSVARASIGLIAWADTPILSTAIKKEENLTDTTRKLTSRSTAAQDPSGLNRRLTLPNASIVIEFSEPLQKNTNANTPL